MKARTAKFKVFDPKKVALEAAQPGKAQNKDKSGYIFEKYGMDAEQMAEEMERLKVTESEARDEVIMIH